MMLCLPDVKMPNNCHECDGYGICDVVRLKCPCNIDMNLYDFEKRPKECPLKEIKDEKEVKLIKPIDSDILEEQCKKSIDSGEPICDYNFYYNVIAYLREWKYIVYRLKEDEKIIDALLKVGYPHDFQREEPWIIDYMYLITDVIRKAVNFRNEERKRKT